MNVVCMYGGQSAGVPVTCSAALQEHPVWGEGLLVTGSHNTDWSTHERDGVHGYVRTLADNDRIRYSTGSATDLLGSWCLDTDNRPTFVTFVPAPLCEAGILIRLMDQLLGRFDWMGRYALQEMANNQAGWLAS
jgi:hypothetical protein